MWHGKQRLYWILYLLIYELFHFKSIWEFVYSSVSIYIFRGNLNANSLCTNQNVLIIQNLQKVISIHTSLSWKLKRKNTRPQKHEYRYESLKKMESSLGSSCIFQERNEIRFFRIVLHNKINKKDKKYDKDSPYITYFRDLHLYSYNTFLFNNYLSLYTHNMKVFSVSIHILFVVTGLSV